MSDIAIRVDGVSKMYRLGEPERYRTLRDSVTDAITAPFRRLRGGVAPRKEAETLWALKDVSFEVKHGEVIGIIGRNGAGKSTLLKILSRITEPTSGQAEIRGRVGSLLEVGTGFHPELTGRENIFLNGAILGMKKAEILRKFDEIVSFAEVEKFIDTPVKHYSSGMYVRLAFAVAAHMETENLIVDEVLAVGDAEFQKKCLGKMRDASYGGRTVLFVSHNIGAVSSLCTRGLFLEGGRLKLAADVQSVIGAYLASGLDDRFEVEFREGDRSAGDEVIRLRGARIIGPTGKPQGHVSVLEEAWIEVDYDLLQEWPSPRINLHFSTLNGDYAFASIENSKASRKSGPMRCRMRLPPEFLNSKRYLISIYLTSLSPGHLHGFAKDALTLEVVDALSSETRQGYDGHIPGGVRPLMDWELRAL